MQPTSSNIKQSSSRSASTTRFPILKTAPLKSSVLKQRVAVIAKPTRPNPSSSDEIMPRSISGFPPFVTTVNLKTVLDFFHIPNLSNASLDEAIFLHTLYSSLATQARLLAAILPWSLERPLQELLAAMNEPDKSYTKQNARTRRPSGSQASLKKRS